MANSNSPFGFRYFARLEGGAPTEGLSTRAIASTYNTSVFQGDPVISLSTGYVAAATTGTSQVYGIAYNFEYLNTAISRNLFASYWGGTSNAGSNCAVGCSADTDAMFLVQSNGTAITFADIGANIGYATGSGSTTTGISAYTVDQGTIGTTSTLPFRIVGLYSQFAPPGTPGADDTTPYNQIVVTFNNQDFKTTTGT